MSYERYTPEDVERLLATLRRHRTVADAEREMGWRRGRLRAVLLERGLGDPSSYLLPRVPLAESYGQPRGPAPPPVPMVAAPAPSPPAQPQPPPRPVAEIDQLERALRRSRAELADEKRRREQAEQRADAALERADLAEALRTQPSTPPISAHVPRSRTKSSAIPVLLCSDWHVEEIVDPASVNGRNEFTPDIARRRVEYLFEGYAWLVEQWAKSWDIRGAIVWLGGDLISGNIHEELLEGNAMSPTEATLLVQQMVSDGLEYLLHRCPFLQRITVPCNFGNHGRSTPKRRVSTAAQNSFEWLMYQSLKTRHSRDSRLVFHVASGAHLYSEVFGTRVRWHHGDDIRYHGGVGGLSIPLRKAVDSWDEFKQVDLTCVGHYHAFADYQYAMCNGSLIGFNAYALSIKARWEPPRQAAFLIDAEWGRRLVTPVYCDPDRKAGAE